MRCVDMLLEKGLSVGGIATPEIREHGRRVGFYVLDLGRNKKTVLAGVEVNSKFRIGKYRVDIEGFNSIALPALDYAENHADIICIDELGPMELFSEQFRLRVEELFSSQKVVITVLHRRLVKRYSEIGKIFHVSSNNRSNLPIIIVEHITNFYV